MGTTYIKCHHGNLKKDCMQCEKEKRDTNIYDFVKKTLTEDKRTPILRGCQNEICFCTGKCKEIIGYQE